MKGIIAPFYLDFQEKKSSFPFTYPASISQVARKELPRNVQRFRDLFLKKTHIVSQRDRMISSFLVLLLCSTSQRPSLRWQKRRREFVDISTRPSFLLARDNRFWTVLLLLRKYELNKGRIFAKRNVFSYLTFLDAFAFVLAVSTTVYPRYSFYADATSTKISPGNTHAQL